MVENRKYACVLLLLCSSVQVLGYVPPFCYSLNLVFTKAYPSNRMLLYPPPLSLVEIVPLSAFKTVGLPSVSKLTLSALYKKQ